MTEYFKHLHIPEELNLVPLKGAILFPGAMNSVRISGITLDEYKMLNRQKSPKMVAAVSLRKDFNLPDLESNDFYAVATLSNIEDARDKDGELLLDLRGVERIKIHHIHKEFNLLYTQAEFLETRYDLDRDSSRILAESVKDMAGEIASFFEGTEDVVEQMNLLQSPLSLIYSIIPYLNLSRSKKQELLEEASLKKMGMTVLDHMIRQKESIRIQAELANKMTEKASRSYRENVLREQLKVIQKELHDNGEEGEESLKTQIEKSAMPADIKKTAMKELEKLEAQPPGSPETRNLRNYLDLMLQIPWEPVETGSIDLGRSRLTLDTHHYGLEKVKKRIIQHLAVMKLKNDKKGSILLLIGPPGTGKTSLGRSIAEALERPYVRVSLGGVRDEAEIRGHRRTYVGALPGRIIKGMVKAGATNPVFVLDEVDKLTVSNNGDPAGALLEVLDPEQNNSFADHYLEVPYDLSDVFFIATANSVDSIPGPLLDRMEVITLSGYTNPEKVHIGQNHLVPQILKDHGLNENQLEIGEDALEELVENYTREAGVRGLKRQIAALARAASQEVVENVRDLPIILGRNNIEDYLETRKVRHETIGKMNPPGVVTGMAWTPVGGEILFVESTHMPGNGSLTITGQLGDVMKESARISLSLIRSKLSPFTSSFAFKEEDIHIHVPSGAVPKDGPSAGVTLLTSLTSMILGKPVKPDLAMTGEVTLRGAVLPVGGIKEKVIAAHRAGIKTVIIPWDNEKDIEELPEEVKGELTVVPVSNISDVLQTALGMYIPEMPMEESVFFNQALHAQKSD